MAANILVDAGYVVALLSNRDTHWPHERTVIARASRAHRKVRRRARRGFPYKMLDRLGHGEAFREVDLLQNSA